MELNIKDDEIDNIVYDLIVWDRFCYLTKAIQYKYEGSTKNIKTKYDLDIYRVFYLDIKSVLHSVKFFDNLKEANDYFNVIRNSEKHYEFIKTSEVNY